MSAFGSTRALGTALTREKRERTALPIISRRRVSPGHDTSGFRIEGPIAFPGCFSSRAHGGEIKQLPVHKVRGHEIGERAEHGIDAAGVALLPFGEHALHLL